MFVFLSKFLPLFAYPVGLACVLLALGLIFRRKRGWFIALTAAALAVLVLGGNRWVAFGLARPLEWKYLPPAEVPQAEVIVVLGGGTDPANYPSQGVGVNSAGDRVIYAIRLYKQGKADHILVSGGSIEWLGERATTPADEMRDLLLLAGIPDEAIWMESKSLNTYENAVECNKILTAQGIHRILLVTSALHMPRSVALFEARGLEVIPLPVDYQVTDLAWDNMLHGDWRSQLVGMMPTSSNLDRTTIALKEYIGILIYRLRGWM